MARRTVISTHSDLTGADGASTFPFGIDGVSYEIDLTPDETARLRELLGPYIAAGRKVATKSPTRRSSALSESATRAEDPAAVRAWARENGVALAERGRIPKDVLDAFRRAS